MNHGIRSLVILGLAFAAAAHAQTLDTIAFRANMSAANEVPPLELAATGSATILVHPIRNSSGTITSAYVDFNIRYQFPGEITITGLHIHRGIAGANGPVLIDTGIRAGSTVQDTTGRAGISRQAYVTSADGLQAVRDMLVTPSDFYVNLHTSVNPGGAIRGQVMGATINRTMAILSPANEVPAITGLNASGVSTVTLILARNSSGTVVSGEATFDVAYTGFPADTKFTGLHVHTGEAGVNGPVTINSGLSGQVDAAASGTGNLRYTLDVNASAAASAGAAAGLLTNPANYYVNLHTTVNPGGAIRGQSLATDTVRINVNPTTAQEVPPVTDVAATSVGFFDIATVRGTDGRPVAANTNFSTAVSFPGEATLTGLHIHEGVAGQNGPVRIDSAIRAGALVPLNTNLHLSRQATFNSGAPLDALRGLLVNPAGFYWNIHTQANPSGVMRAQLATANTTLPTITDVVNITSSQVLTVVRPGGTFTVRGTNLAFIAGSASSVMGGTNPTALNGTSVTVAGVAATLISVSPTEIVGRVPASVQLGPLPVLNVPVVVTTGNGTSNVGNLTLASWAPAN